VQSGGLNLLGDGLAQLAGPARDRGGWTCALDLRIPRAVEVVS